MQKAIYMNVVIQFNEGGRSSEKPAADRLGEKVADALQRGTAKAALKGEIKRQKAEPVSGKNDVQLNLLVYLEGEQEPAESFTALATDELSKLLATSLKGRDLSDLKARVITIEENTNAVDEMADEADNPA